jgi:hypothetical protein
MLLSCKGTNGGSTTEDNQDSTSSADGTIKTGTSTGQLTPFLPGIDARILYLENFANDANGEHEQLKRLLGTRNNPNKEKAAFEFFVTTENVLGAKGFPAKKGNKDYVLPDAFPLRISKQKVTLQQPDTLFLSALQLDNGEGSIVDVLQDRTYDQRYPNRNAGFEYILFIPRVDTNRLSPNYRHLVFDVAKLKPEIPFNKDRLVEYTILSVANPTPPRRVY